MSASIEDLVYGEDGEQPMRGSIETFLAQAKEDEVRLKIEIRSRMKGTTKSNQERTFEIDPNVVNVDSVMATIDKSLKDSPGEDFTGQIRINFAQAGSSNKYGSFTRSVRASYLGAPGTMGLNPDNYDDDYEGDNTLGDLHNSPSPMAAMNMFGGMNQGPVSQEDLRAWMETTMNFTFRSFAMMQQMFERTIQMQESLHFGLARPMEPGIVETRGPASNDNGPGMLGALLNTAASLAKAQDPGEAVAAAAQLASGSAQPESGTARQLAIKKAGQAVNQLSQKRNTTPYDDELEDYDDDLDPDTFPMVPDDDGGPDDEDDGSEGAEIDWESMEDDEVKEGFLRWVRSNPENKRKVMDMLPELSKEVM